MGCGVAYHLAHEGWTDIVLAGKGRADLRLDLARGGPDHPFDLVLRLGKCVDYNIGLYSGALEAETGQSVTWHGCGSFRLAYTEDEMDWLRQTLSVGRALGFNIELVGPDFIRVAELHPFYNLDGVIGALHTPDDGHVDPSGVTHGDGHWRAATRARGSSAAAAPPTSPNCRPANGKSRPSRAISCASTWSMPAAPMPARWANGPACSCR
jgi:glycine/D-amino acid oxidase-like deaminating enzyme